MKALGMITFSTFLMLYRGWVLTHLWRWFIVPIFDTSPLGSVEAVGLVICTAVFQSPSLSDMLAGIEMEDRPNAKIEKMVFSYFVPIIYTSVTLILGWLWHLFV